MGHYSDAEEALDEARGDVGQEHLAYLLKTAHVHAMLAVADAIGHQTATLEKGHVCEH